MCRESTNSSLVVSVVDITDDYELHQYADITSESGLKDFMDNNEQTKPKVRLYLVEPSCEIEPDVIEILGSRLSLDPRFFQWNIHGSTNLMDPAERHRAPFISIGFTILKTSTPTLTVIVFNFPPEQRAAAV